MFKIGKYILLGVWLMLSIFVASAQTFDYAAKTSLAPSGAEVGETPADGVEGSASDPYKACPSYDAIPNTSIFSIPFDAAVSGNPTQNQFIWVVYGGSITPPTGAVVIESGSEVVDAVNQITRSYVVYSDGLDGTGTKTSITVQWDALGPNFDLANAWVAAQQRSEWNCTDSKWSLYHINIENTPPTFTPTSDFNIAYGQRGNATDGYTLPVFTVTDPDNCPAGSLVYSYVVDRPTLSDLTGTDTNLPLSGELEVGVNTVTWTVVNGNKTITDSYDIIVEPELHILNVAWINPSCENNNGSVRVSNTTDLSSFSVPISYSLSSDGGSTWGTWQADPYFGSLAAGAYQIKASLEYNPGPDEFLQESEVYEFTLSAMAANAVSGNGIFGNIPSQRDLADVGDDELTIVPTDCGNGDEGQISMDPAKMVSQNSSIRLDGIDDYLLLNKSFNETVSEFSAAVWLKTTAISGTILSFNNSNYFQLELNDGRLQMAHNSTVAPNASFLVSNLTYRVNDGQWHLVLATYNAGTYKLYIDGVERAQKTVAGEPAIGGAGLLAYGLIGATSRTTDINNPQIAPGSSYFAGQLVEVGLWSRALSADEVRVVQRKGMTHVSGGLTDHWVLNSTPSIISSEVTEASAPVFSDAGNRIDPTTNRWARFVNQPSLVGTDAPRLYSWEDNPDDPDPDFTENLTALGYDRAKVNMSDPGLKTGQYRLTVSDILGCGAQSETYTIQNGDDEPPYFLWNVSANKQARQSSTALNGEANQASDALFDTYSQTDVNTAVGSEWWEVDLGNTYPINRVQLYPNGTLSDVFVLLSTTPFGGSSELADDQAPPVVYEHISGNVGYGQSVEFPGTNARFVRIRRADPNATLALNEVVVLTAYPDPELRKLYLTGGDCEYTISTNDAAIDPIAVDACGNPMKSLTYIAPDLSDRDLNTTLIDDDGLPLYTQFEATWTAIDENDKTAELKIRYEVVDEEKPVIHGNPFAGVDGTMSYCDAQDFRFPIPNITDNLDGCPSKYLQSITLFRNGLPVTLADADKINTVGYDHDAPGLLARIPDDMQPGTHSFQWRVVDYSGNETVSASYSISIQKEPLLEEISYVPNSCPGAGSDGAIYFSKLQSENDNIPLPADKLQITYRLTNIDDATNVITSFSPVIPTNTPGIQPGATYKASFVINDCPSNPNYQNITINQPEVIALNELVSDVICWGDQTGGIDLTPSGGSQTNILHLSGTESEVTASAYSALDLTDQGMIEAWVFLDDLNANGVNNMNAGIFGRLGCYGLKLSAGVPLFYVGSDQTSGVAALPVREWVHLAGSFTWDGSNGTATLYVNGAAVGTPVALTGAPPTTGNIAIGSLGQAGATDNLMGFVRNARIWNAMPASDIFEVNRKLVTPIDNSKNVVANYPMNEASGAEVKNVSNNSFNGTASGAEGVDFKRQKFAYFWRKPDATFLTFNEDITNAGAGIYTVTLYDAAGCSAPFNPEIETDDQTAPTMDFFTTRDRTTTLNIGVPLVRYTNNDDGAVGNQDEDCYYVPYSVDAGAPGEFDPTIKDGACNTDYVKLTYQVWDEDADNWVDPVVPELIVPSNPSRDQLTLNGSNMSGITLIKWRAQDRSQKAKIPEEFTEREVTYYIVDNEAPTDIRVKTSTDPAPAVWQSVVDVIVTRSVDAECKFTVPAGDALLEPIPWDNCGTGRLYNQWNSDATLTNYVFTTPNTYTIDWTYEDFTFPGITTDPYNGNAVIPYSVTKQQTLRVIDDTPPSVSCRTFTDPLYLGDGGTVSLRTLDVLNVSADNCVQPTLVLTKNMANGMTGTTTSSTETVLDNRLLAVDNSIDAASGFLSNDANAWWQVDLGAEHDNYGIRLFASSAATLSNFWIVVHNEASFTTPADLSVSSPAWVGDVAEAIYVADPIAANQQFLFSRVRKGQYVRIIKADANPLGFAEVEVFGAPTPGADVTLTCVDARHTPHPTPSTAPDTYDGFGPIGVLLSATDASGNVFSCLSEIKLVDDIHPTVIGAGLDVSPDENGVITINAATLGAPSTDNCDIVDYWTNDVLDCDDKGSNNITLWVMDEFGLKSSALVSINVDDNVKPIARAKATVIIELDDQGQFVITDAMARAFLEDSSNPLEQSSDNCNDIVYAKVVPNTFSCDQAEGAFIPLSYTVTDGSNNVSEPFIIMADVQDNMLPTPSIQNFNLTLSKEQNDVILVSDFDAGGYDNCGLDYVGIYFDEDDSDNLCIAGSEGSAGDAVVSPRASIGNIGADHNPHSGTYPLANATDDAFTATAYVTEQTTANTERTVTLTFTDEYNISQSSVYWHKANLVGETAVSHDVAYLRMSNVTSNDAWSSQPASNCVDGNISASGRYETYDSGGNSANYTWVQYVFEQPLILTSCRLQWHSGNGCAAPRTSNYQPRIEYYNGSSWVSMGDIGISTSDFNEVVFSNSLPQITRIRVLFDKARNNYVGIREWYVYGYPAPRQYDGIIPSAAIVEYQNTISGDGEWRSFAGGNQGVAYPNINTVLVPVASAVSATAMRLRFRNATETGYLGIKDWEVWGSKVGATSYCKTWTCSDVGTHTAHIVYVTKSGQKRTVDKTFQVLPYFTIDDIQLKDCAVTGEQYWSWYTNLPDSYTFLWEKVPQSGTYILSDGIGNNTGVHSWSSTSETIAQLRVSDDNGRSVPDGEYTIRLTVTDNANEGCKVTRDMTFTARDDLNVNRSIEEFYVCKGDEETFTMELVVPNTYYGSGGVGRCDNNRTCQDLFYNWDYSEVSYVSGGTVKDPTVKVSFPSVGTFDVECGVSGNQRYVQYGNGSATAFPTVVPLPVGTNMNCSSSSPCFNFGTDFIGPFNFSDAQKITNNNNYDASGKNVVKISTSSGYYQVCDEGKIYRVTVYDVATPTLVDPVLEVCPFEQVTYTTSLTGYENYKWTITGGRKVTDGSGSDLSVLVEWNMDEWPTKTPKIELEVTNFLGCKATQTWNVTYDQTTGIAFLPASMVNITQNADVGSCAHTFPSIAPPVVVMPNSCDYQSLECSTDGVTWKASAAGTYTGIGDHLIQWRARDYFYDSAAEADKPGHEVTWTQTITIVDAEQPRFDVGKTPTNKTLQTIATTLTCGLEFPDGSCDVDATDGGDCTPKTNLVFTREWFNPATSAWEPLTTTNAPAATNNKTLQGIYFNVGVTRVRYTVTDGITAPRAIEFNVTVQDKTPPTFEDLPDVVCNTDLNQKYATIASVTTAGLAVPANTVANTDQFTDNCPVTDAEFNATVTLVSRSDGGNDITKNYPIGITVLEWRVADKANNYTTKFQNVLVSDIQPPWFEASATENLSAQKSISYCARNGYQLGIPTPKDNDKVKSIRYVVTKNSDASVVVDQTLTNFNPLGNGLTAAFDFTGVDANSITNDYTVTWTAIDESNNSTEDGDPKTTFSYKLHIELEPLMGNINEFPMSCGGAYDASITIPLAGVTYDQTDKHLPYAPEFSIDNGANWTSSNSFTGLGNQTYTVMMRVNNCVSRASTWKTVTFTAPDAYKIRATGLNNTCEEDAGGKVTAIMDQGGGAKGQWLFNGTNGFTVANYDELNLTTTGAIEAWVYLDNLDNATIVQKGTAPNGYGLVVNNNKFALWVGNSSVLESTYGIAAQRWYHVSAWWDATTMNIAVDGAANLTTAPGSYNANTPATGDLTLGGAGFDGILRTVRIWDIPVTGAIASSAISPATPGLVGYWEISEGVGTTATSYDSYGYNASTASASWVTNRPQPGFYTWTRNGVAYPLASNQSNIHLENLSKGRYEVTFIDPYNCPATGITTFYNVLATDNALPVISFPVGRTLPLPVKADPGDCAYAFDGDVLTNDPYTDALLPAAPIITDVAYYTPTVDDGNDCDYTITWQVIPVDGNATTYTKKVTGADPTDNRINGMEVTRQGTNGSNRVRVTVAQNGMTLDPPFEYYIQVQDAEIPVAKGKTSDVSSMNLDNTPGGDGKVAYYAWQFDNGSTDNCTKTLDKMKPEFAYEDPVANPLTPWYTSVDLGCDAIGNSVQLYYRVYDEAGNESLPISSTSSFNVQDVHPPVFYSTMITLESQCATDYDGEKGVSYTTFDPATIVAALGADLKIEEGTLATEWKDYTDNCKVKRIRYKLRHTTNASLSTDWFGGTVTDPELKDANVGADGTTRNRFYVGTTEVVFSLSDKDNPVVDTDWVEKVMFRVIILPQPAPGQVAPSPEGSPGIN